MAIPVGVNPSERIESLIVAPELGVDSFGDGGYTACYVKALPPEAATPPAGRSLGALAAFVAIGYALSWGWTFPLAAVGDVVEKGRGWPTNRPCSGLQWQPSPSPLGSAAASELPT